MHDRRRQLGSFTPLAGGVVLVFALLALGGLTIGRLTAVKADSQRAADAAALAGAQLIRDNGMPFDGTLRARAETVGRANSVLPIDFVWSLVEDGDSVDLEVTTQINVQGPTLVIGGGSKTVESRAKASITQTRFDDADRRLPKLIMVLDYSGSMNAAMPGGGGARAIDVLKASVNNLLDADLRIDYGMVIYSGGILSVVPPGEGTPSHINNIRNAVNGRGAGGMTCTSCGLNRARELLLGAGDDTGRYVLLVSDGAPTAGGNEAGARSAANSLWAIEASNFSLHIDSSGGGDPALRNFLISVSGAYTSHPDAGYYFYADDASSLRDTFEIIVSSIVCSVGPLDPIPADAATLKVYLASGAAERGVISVPAGGDLYDFRDQERYVYDTATQTIKLTELACDAVIDDGDEIVIRFDKPDLIE
jgi:hypothetical protein